MGVISFTLRPLYSGDTASGIYWIGGWVGFRAGTDAEAKRKTLPLPGIKPRSPTS